MLLSHNFCRAILMRGKALLSDFFFFCIWPHANAISGNELKYGGAVTFTAKLVCLRGIASRENKFSMGKILVLSGSGSVVSSAYGSVRFYWESVKTQPKLDWRHSPLLVTKPICRDKLCLRAQLCKANWSGDAHSFPFLLSLATELLFATVLVLNQLEEKVIQKLCQLKTGQMRISSSELMWKSKSQSQTVSTCVKVMNKKE